MKKKKNKLKYDNFVVEDILEKVKERKDSSKKKKKK